MGETVKKNKIYTEASVYSAKDWDLSRLRSLLRNVNSGEMSFLGDFCEFLSQDSRVQSGLGLRVRGLLRLPIFFEDGEPRPQKALAEDFIKFAPETTLLQIKVWGLLMGVGLAQIIWKSIEGRWVPVLEWKDSRNLTYNHLERQWYLRTLEEPKLPITPGDGQWFMYTPYGTPYTRPWNLAMWKALALPVLIKYDSAVGWARDNEVGALRVAEAPEGTEEQDWKETSEELTEIGSETSVVLPPGYKMTVQAPPANIWLSKAKAIDWSDTSTTIIVWGQNLTTEVKDGAFASTSIHRAVQKDLLASDEEIWTTQIRNQVLSWWAQYNFGSAEKSPWLRYNVQPPFDALSEAQTLNTLGDALGKLEAIGIDTDPILTKFSLTRRPGYVPSASLNKPQEAQA